MVWIAWVLHRMINPTKHPIPNILPTDFNIRGAAFTNITTYSTSIHTTQSQLKSEFYHTAVIRRVEGFLDFWHQAKLKLGSPAQSMVLFVGLH